MNRWLLALGFAALLGIGACCGSDEEVVDDPVEDPPLIVTPMSLVETLFEGVAKLDVSSTYGQFWAIGGSAANNITLHEGIDFAAPEGTPVRAIERGRVRLIDGESTGYYAQVLVVSEADPTRGWLYVHVDDTNRAVEAEIDVIEPGEQLGEICADPTGTAPPHLHLQRVHVHDAVVACPLATASTQARLYPTLGNPLDELVVPDEVDPEILAFAVYPADAPGSDGSGFVELHSPVSGDYLDPIKPADAQDKELVLVVRVADRFLAGGPVVAPKSVALSIVRSDTGAELALPPLEFGGPLRTECGGSVLGSEAYMVSAWRKSKGDYTQREFYVRVTTRLEDVGGGLMAFSAPWTSAAGKYALTLTVTDASGRSMKQSLDLELGSS